MAGKSYKYVVANTTSLAAVETFYSSIQDLLDEISEIIDNTPEALQSTPRIEALSETKSILEDIQIPDFVDVDTTEALVGNEEIKVTVAQPKNKKATTSRAVRLENSCAYGHCGIEAMREWSKAEEAEIEELEKSTSGDPKRLDVIQKRQSICASVIEFCDQVEEHINAVEGCEFPGQFG